MVTSELPILREKVIKTDDANARVLLVAPHVIFIAQSGKATLALLRPIQAEMEQVLVDAGKLHLFADASDVGGYESQYRVAWSQWFKTNRSKLVRVEVLVGSKLLAMGVAVMNLFIGGDLMRGYDDRAQFERELRRAADAARS